MGDGLVLVPDEPRQRAEEVTVVDHDFVRIRADRARDLTCVFELAVRALLERDREGLERTVDHPGHQRGDRAAVEPAGEKHPERHVRHQPRPHRLLERVTESIDRLTLRERVVGRLVVDRRDIPPHARPGTSVFEDEKMSRQQTMNPFEQRLGAREIAGAQELGDGRFVGLGLDQTALEDGFDLRAEHQTIADDRPVERLDPEPVARQQQSPPRPVPDRKREHAAEPLEGAISPLLVGVEDRFSVAARLVAVSGRLEESPDLRVVVDLAVENDPDAVVLVGQRLLTRGEIDDAETAMGQAGDLIAVQAGFVGSTVGDDVAHDRQLSDLARRQPIGGDDASDAAHGYIASANRGRAAAARSTNCRNQSSSMTSCHSR